MSHIPIRVRGLIYANHFQVTWDWRHYFWATVLAIIAVFIASYVPARRAALLAPVRDPPRVKRAGAIVAVPTAPLSKKVSLLLRVKLPFNS